MTKRLSVRFPAVTLALTSLLVGSCSMMPGMTIRPYEVNTPNSYESPYTQTQSEARSQMVGMRGLNDHAYLTEQVQESINQLNEMSKTAQMISRDIDGMEPASFRIKTLEREIDQLTRRFMDLQNNLYGDIYSQADMPKDIKTKAAKARPKEIVGEKVELSPPTRSVKETPKKAPVKTSPASTGYPTVLGVRIGEHADKTRIVLDIRGSSTPRYDVDNDTGLLTIEVPGLTWSAPATGKAHATSVISGYSATPTDSGTIVAVSLKRNTSIADFMTLGATRSKPARLVFDLKK